MNPQNSSNPEILRVRESQNEMSPWRLWGPYVSDRAWGTVREDYSSDGDAWNYLPHSLARSKAYRWGEDGIAGICDRFQLLVFAPAFWNGRDPILKERLFGLTPFEGNHGEDVKEYYFHLDNTPTHSYMKFLYKYPHDAFPYEKLVRENQLRNGQGFEYELLDTGVFDDDRYFDIYIEYAKHGPEEICCRIEVVNRGPDAAELHVLPQLWFRNIWAWGDEPRAQPKIEAMSAPQECQIVVADNSQCVLPPVFPADYKVGRMSLCVPNGGELLFTNNETNEQRVFEGRDTRETFFKDAFHEKVVNGKPIVNPANLGSKFAAHYSFDAIPPGDSVVLKLRLGRTETMQKTSLDDIDAVIELRKSEADEFYQTICASAATDEQRDVQRSALAGLFWTKQNYIFDVDSWLNGSDGNTHANEDRKQIRNMHWRHLNSMRILTMPDKWEYPWFAAWDLAFHCVSFAMADPHFAKDQLQLMLFEQFQHPNGQIPAYEWEFSDVNPPVHAWAVWKVFNMERFRFGNTDYAFLERCFHKLLVNFTWWINKVDRNGNNVFEGGFLGLDNITVIDRSADLGEGVALEQADGSGWMAMFCQQMMRIALELAKENPIYEGMATKFFQHYIYIAAAMKRMGHCQDCRLWDDEDGFFYDVLRYPDGHYEKFRVRSLVGLIPLFAVERLERKWIEPFQEFRENLDWFLRNREDLVRDVVHTVSHGDDITHVLTVVDRNQLTRVLERVWDRNEFLSPFGMRSLSKYHEQHPFEFNGSTVQYEPAESISKIKGGNSNWRGPIWFPTNYLLLDSLRRLGKAFGDGLLLRPPAFEGRPVNARQLAEDLSHRLIQIFVRDSQGRKACFGSYSKFSDDPHWKDLPLFHEYFHGDNAAGLGASHQTGWTALVANIIDEWCR